jgi:hypothetical protein
LVAVVREVEEAGELAWAQVAARFNELSPFQDSRIRNSKQCRERYTNHLDTDVVKGDWTPQEDIAILQLIDRNGKKWTTFI